VVYLMVIFQYSHGETDENNDRLRRYIRCPVKELNRVAKAFLLNHRTGVSYLSSDLTNSV
jgi:hypothetical protein